MFGLFSLSNYSVSLHITLLISYLYVSRWIFVSSSKCQLRLQYIVQYFSNILYTFKTYLKREPAIINI